MPLAVSPLTSSFQTASMMRRVCWVMAFSWETISVVVSMILLYLLVSCSIEVAFDDVCEVFAGGDRLGFGLECR